MGLGRNEIAAHLRDGIKNGLYPAGRKLPSYRELAMTLGGAPNTVGEAVRILSTEGLVRINPNSGAVVRSADDIDTTQEERTAAMRGELGQIQNELRDVRSQINALDRRVSNLLANLDE